MGLLSQVFPKEVMDCIFASHPPYEALRCDKIIWKMSTNGAFSVRTAYRSLELMETSTGSNR